MNTLETERPSARPSGTRRASPDGQSLAMREALAHVGELMRLPPKRPAAAAVAAPAAATFELPSIGGRKLWLPVLAVSLAATFAAVKFWPRAALEVPTGLQREWATSHPKYAKSRIAFTERQVVLSANGGAATAHTIENIATTYRGDTTKIVLNYAEEGGLTELRVALVARPTPRLIFSRPDGLVWEPVAR